MKRRKLTRRLKIELAKLAEREESVQFVSLRQIAQLTRLDAIRDQADRTRKNGPRKRGKRPG
jgi:hypothetical protein